MSLFDREAAADQVVFGSRCVWWGSPGEASWAEPKDEARTKLVCPHCRGGLQMVSEASWWEATERYGKETDPEWPALVRWLKGRCFPSIHDARRAWYAETTATDTE